MNEFDEFESESDWISLNQSFVQQWSESKMTVSESKMAEFKMAAIIKLSQNEWVKSFYVLMVGRGMSILASVSEFESKY